MLCGKVVHHPAMLGMAWQAGKKDNGFVGGTKHLIQIISFVN